MATLRGAITSRSRRPGKTPNFNELRQHCQRPVQSDIGRPAEYHDESGHGIKSPRRSCESIDGKQRATKNCSQWKFERKDVTRCFFLQTGGLEVGVCQADLQPTVKFSTWDLSYQSWFPWKKKTIGSNIDFHLIAWSRFTPGQRHLWLRIWATWRHRGFRSCQQATRIIQIPLLESSTSNSSYSAKCRSAARSMDGEHSTYSNPPSFADRATYV